MRILWVCNIILPKIANALGLESPVLGGWLTGASIPILNSKEDRLIYMFPFNSEIEGSIGNLTYISYKEPDISVCADELIIRFRDIVKSCKPDIVHIWGTEYAHALAMTYALQSLDMLNKMVISIQGLIHKCAEVYNLGLNKKVQTAQTIRDIIRHDSISKQQEIFTRRGLNEIETLKIAKNIIGRTEWDKNTCLNINPNLKYYKCNESLRSGFYDADQWKYEKCKKYSIFCAQGGYPIKGLHFALNALRILRDKYEDVSLRVPTEDFVHTSFLDRQKRTYYFSYLRELVKKYKLEKNIVFLGSLDEGMMIKEYQCANVFLSSSVLENSSNSIGEAMLIGTPIVASNVGGCSSILENNITALIYKVDDTFSLAEKISLIFEDYALANRLGANAKEVAIVRHDNTANNIRLREIYKKIIED